ncbi:hypothetical protein PUN28_005565 [Cardiocondyla obscurior]|uniref:Secreted protein n=1 Tax=Cardiocondyla obscurior TaxID=286306 RepID=A0AAW2GH57_9HYME
MPFLVRLRFLPTKLFRCLTYTYMSLRVYRHFETINEHTRITYAANSCASRNTHVNTCTFINQLQNYRNRVVTEIIENFTEAPTRSSPSRSPILLLLRGSIICFCKKNKNNC